MDRRSVRWLLFSAWLAVWPLHGGETLTLSAIGGSVNTRISAEVVSEAYRRIGLAVRIKEYPAARALWYAQQGHTDGELFRIAGVEREYPDLIPVPVAVNRLEAMVYTRGECIVVAGWDSLRPYRVGVRRGVEFSERGTRDMHPVVVNSNGELFGLLRDRVADLVVIARVNGLETLAHMPPGGIRVCEPPLEHDLLYHYVHSKNAHLVPRLAKALGEMKRQGLIATVRARFLAALEGRSP